MSENYIVTSLEKGGTAGQMSVSDVRPRGSVGIRFGYCDRHLTDTNEHADSTETEKADSVIDRVRVHRAMARKARR